MQQIAQHTGLTHKNVIKTCLLVLIQHNCVQAFSIEHQGNVGQVVKVLTHFMVVFDKILHRMRFSQFLVIVSEEFGEECQGIVEQLLKHGRLTLEQVKESQSPHKIEAQANFVRLVNAHFVERCPAGEPSVVPPTKEEANAGKKRSTKLKRVEKPVTIEQLAIAAAAPMEAERFFVITDTETDANENSMDSHLRIPVGEKRKLDVSEMDEDSGGSKSNKEVLWRVNFEKFVERLRHKACIANVRSRLDEEAATVLSAALETKKTSVTFTLNTIYEEVMKTERGRTLTFDHVRASLAMLDCEKSGIDEYSIDLNKIIAQAQNEEIESLVLKKYGKEAYKIFRLLSEKQCLYETDKISDIAFVDKLETPKILYKLWKDAYVHMERVATATFKSQQLLLWKVNKDAVWEHILDDMYHAALNLSLRLAHENEENAEVVSEAQRMGREKLTGPIADKYKRHIETLFLLVSSLTKIDNAIMLFNDF